MSGGAWSNDEPRNLTIPPGAGPSDPRTVIGVSPLPAELVAYYAAGINITPTPPETIVSCTINYDGTGKYAYQATVLDATATRVTSIVAGAVQAGVVNESTRLMVNPNFAIGGGRYLEFIEATKLQLQTDGIADPTIVVLGASSFGDVADRGALTAAGKWTWGDGTNAVDTTLYRSTAATLASSGIKADIGGSAETWHAVTYQNSWVDSGGTDVPGEYRRIPSPYNEVECVGSAKNGTHTNGTTVFTLPVGYRPAHKILRPIACQGTAAAGSDSPRMEINTTGAVNIVGCVTGAIFWGFNFPIDT